MEILLGDFNGKQGEKIILNWKQNESPLN
jgi:hypothetical protein